MRSAGCDAVAEFQKLLDHRSIVPNSPLIPLARAAQARAHAEHGEVGEARRDCEEVLASWTQADRHVPVIEHLEEACRKIR